LGNFPGIRAPQSRCFLFKLSAKHLPLLHQTLHSVLLYHFSIVRQTGGGSFYALPRFSWLPKIETFLIDNPEVPPQGGGEPGIVVVAAMIGNAIFNATGARVFELPMSRERVKEALAKAGKIKP